MKVQRVLDLIDLVAEADIAQLTVSEGTSKIHLERQVTVSNAFLITPREPAQSESWPPVATAEPTRPQVEPVASVPEVKGKLGHQVRAPMVGIFHRSAKPGAEPFVHVGARVEKGSLLCVIEAMKIMNDIEADQSGTVTQVLCEQGQSVELDQPLFIIE